MAKYRIVGMPELEKTIKRLGKLPQKCVTKAAKRGSNVALKAARAGAPEDEGYLRKGIVPKGERSRTKGKKVYQVTFDSAMNHHFARVTKDGKRAYYPASQEYGFRTKNGGYVPGFNFMKNAMEDNKSQIERVTVDILSKEIDKLK